MGRRRKGRAINGVFLLDKPLGESSNMVLQKVRAMYGAAKAGHTGALDPLASGMLPICLGEATKFSQFLLNADKTYEVTATLGIRTTTSDADGEVVSTLPVISTPEEITQACLSFLGASKQIPSMFSALKHQGKPLYWYARQGIEIERPARDITLFAIDVLRIEGVEVDLHDRLAHGGHNDLRLAILNGLFPERHAFGHRRGVPMGIGHLACVGGAAGAHMQSSHSRRVLEGGKSDLDIGHGLNR